MLKESGQALPWITQMVVNVSNFVIKYNIWILIFTVVGIATLVSYFKTAPGKIMFDNIQIRLPIFGLLAIKSNLASFFRTLASMIDAGLSINDSLYICVETLTNSVIEKDMKIAQKAIVEGKTFAEPLMKIKYFPALVTQMIKVGEQTGNMDEMLNKIADIFEDEVSILISGMMKMIEPLILVLLGGAVGVILIAMYLPIFMSAGGAAD
jgi:type IV pilus assembly protein PilC